MDWWCDTCASQGGCDGAKPAASLGGTYCSNTTINATAATAAAGHTDPTKCGDGYLCYVFDVIEDPTESNNLADAKPDLLSKLLATLARYQAGNVPCCSCALKPDVTEMALPPKDGVWFTYHDESDPDEPLCDLLREPPRNAPGDALKSDDSGTDWEVVNKDIVSGAHLHDAGVWVAGKTGSYQACQQLCEGNASCTACDWAGHATRCKWASTCYFRKLVMLSVDMRVLSVLLTRKTSISQARTRSGCPTPTASATIPPGDRDHPLAHQHRRHRRRQRRQRVECTHAPTTATAAPFRGARGAETMCQARRTRWPVVARPALRIVVPPPSRLAVWIRRTLRSRGMFLGAGTIPGPAREPELTQYLCLGE